MVRSKAEVTADQLTAYFNRIARAVTIYDEIGAARVGATPQCSRSTARERRQAARRAPLTIAPNQSSISVQKIGLVKTASAPA